MTDIPSINKKLVKLLIAHYYSAKPDIHYIRTNVTRIIFSEVLHNEEFVGIIDRNMIRNWFIERSANKKMGSYYAPHWVGIINDQAIENLVDWDFISRSYEKCGFINDVLDCNSTCTDCHDMPGRTISTHIV
jgi:hypothetical protein